MATNCGDTLSLQDLQTAKKHQLFEAEVITGKAGGVASGADIDFATNQVTGQTQKTLPAVLRDAGFTSASFDFATGGTLGINDRYKAVMWPAPGGNGLYYSWHGALPKTVPANSSPATTGGESDTAWKLVGDVGLRADLASMSGASLVGYGAGETVKGQLDKHTAKTIINVSAFGNTGTEQNGSDEAWDNAFAYALTICPIFKNSYPGPQEWYDFSGIEFVADTAVYPKTSIGFRATIGGTINLTIIAPDDHDPNSYLIDMSKGRGLTPNRDTIYPRLMGAVHCRFVCSGINLGGSGSATIEHMRVTQFLVYGIDTDASDAQKSGGHTLGIGLIVEQRSWSASGDADFPAKVTTGTGIYIRSHDNRMVGATVSYCKLRCVRIKGASNRLVAGTHLYSAGKQALLHEPTSGNTLIDACWLDSSRLQLDGNNITVTNNLIYLTQNSDSEIGIVTGGAASNILITGNSFVGWTGGTPVYPGKGAMGDRRVRCYGNRVLPGMTNPDIADGLQVSLLGGSTAGTVTLDPSTKSIVWQQGETVNFDLTIRWSALAGATGDLEVYGLPFVATTITPMRLVQFSDNALFKGAVPIKHTSGTSIRFIKPDGTTVKANDVGVGAGYLCISGSYRPV